MEGKEKETLCVGWCDPGTVESTFMGTMMAQFLSAAELDLGGIGFIQNVGNQIARQRADLIREFEETGLDWLLWVDSDIMLNQHAVKTLWESRDAIERPIVAGIYFITYENTHSLYRPFPCVFNEDGKQGYKPVHPLPENEIISIDSAGLGFTLMHKSVAHKLRENFGNTTFQIIVGDRHVSEDMMFFQRVKASGIPIHAHTGAFVTHYKRFPLDIEYYNMWWQVVAPIREQQEKELAEKNKQEV